MGDGLRAGEDRPPLALTPSGASGERMRIEIVSAGYRLRVRRSVFPLASAEFGSKLCAVPNVKPTGLAVPCHAYCGSLQNYEF